MVLAVGHTLIWKEEYTLIWKEDRPLLSVNLENVPQWSLVLWNFCAAILQHKPISSGSLNSGSGQFGKRLAGK